MNIDYYIINPTNNITILVETPISKEFQPFVAFELLSIEKKAEQVGFIQKDDKYDISVRMAGGEFCGNASISAAALYNYLNGTKNSVRVSLSEIPVLIEYNQNNSLFKYCAHFNNDIKISSINFECDNQMYTFPIVAVYGISHIIVPKRDLTFSPESVIKDICCSVYSEALGIMIFDENSFTLTPIVYVRSGDTLYRENSCASGTIALGTYLYKEYNKNICANINEPGGILGISVDENNIVLKGNAYIEAKKQVNISI